jgi:hypothetical protein
MLDTENYHVAKDIKISCTRDSSFCSSCIVNSKEVDNKTGLVSITLKPKNQEFLGIIGVSQNKKILHNALLGALGVPECKSAKITIDTYYDVSDVRLSSVFDLNINQSKTDINQPAFIVGLTEDQLELNIPYIGICRNYPDPKFGQSVLLVEKIQRKEDSLSSFDLTQEDFQLLGLFKIDNYD